MKVKKLVALFLVFVLAVSMVACGAKTEEKAPEETKAPVAEAPKDEAPAEPEVKDVKITVFHYMVQATKQAGLDAVEAAFAAEHPEYNITWDNIVYNQGTDYFPQLQTALASGDQPEIMMGNPGLYPDLVEQGYVADLTDNATINGLGLPKGDLGDVSANGRIYGFPIDFKTWGVFYNKAIFADLGIAEPTTYTELLAACDTIAAAGIDPWAHAFGDAVFGDIEMRNYIWTKALAAGDNDLFEKLMNGEGKLADYPYFAEGLELWAQRLKYMRDDAMVNVSNPQLEVFSAGEAAMMYCGTWAIGDLEAMIEGSDFEYGFFVEPIDDAGSAKLNVQVDQCFMVNPNSEGYEVAVEFMEYWVTQGGGSWSAVSLMPLLNGSVADNAPEIVKTLAAIKGSGNIAHYGDFTAPFNSQFTTDWRTYLTAFAESYANGTNQSPEECLANMQAKFDQNIAENG